MHTSFPGERKRKMENIMSPSHPKLVCQSSEKYKTGAEELEGKLKNMKGNCTVKRNIEMDDQDWEPPSEAEMKLNQARRERSDKISKLMSSYLLKGYKMLGIVCSVCETILLQDRQGTNYCVACSELDSDTDKDNPVTNQSAALSMAREMELATGGGIQTGSSDTKTKLSSSTKTTMQGSRSANEGDTLNSTHGSESPQTLSVSRTDVQSWPDHSGNFQQDQAATTHSGSSMKHETHNKSPGSDSGLPSLSDVRLSSNPRHIQQQTSTQQPVSKDSFQSSTSHLSSTCIARLYEKMEWASRELEDTSSVEYSTQLCQLIKNVAEAVAAVRSSKI